MQRIDDARLTTLCAAIPEISSPAGDAYADLRDLRESVRTAMQQIRDAQPSEAHQTLWLALDLDRARRVPGESEEGGGR